MITVIVYYREKTTEINQLLVDLQLLQDTDPHKLVMIQADHDRVDIGPYRLNLPVSRLDLQVRLRAARDRAGQLEQVDQSNYQQRLEKGHRFSSSDKITHWFSRHYLALVNVLLFVYVGLPFLAPVLVKNEIMLPARAIYRVYGTMCHQLAFRSFFLFGQQAYYPRNLAGIDGVASYEAVQGSSEIDLMAARNFLGNDAMGYKVALCQRDVAIYGFMLLFGLIFLLFRRNFVRIPWYAWIVVGLGPIGLDGVSQLTSFATGLPDWLPIRESSPVLRTVTGGIFGWMTAWYLFPMIEETAKEARRIMERKLAVVRQAEQENVE
jgi:uncharacterized membrane protein